MSPYFGCQSVGWRKIETQRLEDYVQNFRHRRKSWPTVRRAAQSLNHRQCDIDWMITESEVLWIGYGGSETTPLGDRPICA